mgnify:CR=1 FL=1
MKTFIDTINFGVKNWWVSLLLGLLYILIAICLMFTPLASYVALSVLFSVSMFVSGTLEILFAVTNRKNISSWGWYLASGIIDLILGIYLMANIGLSMAVLPFIVAFWLMFRGFASTGYAMDLKRYGTRNWGWRTGNPLQYRHYLATRSWSVIPCLYDRVHFADHRHLPGYAFLRTEELAQTEQRIQRINRMLFSAVSNP